MAVSTIPDPYTNGTGLLKPQGAVTAPERFALRTVIAQHHDVISTLCKSHGTDVETLLSQLWLMSRKQPDLLKATPETLIPALSFGIQSGGRFGIDAYVLTFKNNKAGTIEAAPCLNYKFIVSLVIAAGGARSIDVQIIYKGDTFREIHGSSPQLIHEPPPFGTKRGAPIGAYGIAYFGVNVPPRWIAMTLEQIDEVRAKSQQWRYEKVCPLWYMEKTVIRRLAKLLPQKPGMARVLEIIDGDDRLDDAEEGVAELVSSESRPAHITEDGEDVRDQYQDAPSETFGDDEPETVPLAAALAWKVNKQPLGASRNTGLTKIREWAVGKQESEGDDQGRLAYIIACCDTILAARLAGEIAEPEKKEAA